jgi:hypothetical protein
MPMMRPPAAGAVAEGLEQRGHQLAPGEVAGAAEENEVEAHDSFICLGAL